MSVAKPTSWGLKALSRLHVPRMLAAFAIVAGTLASPLTVAPAHAAVGDLTCAVTAQATFSPSLKPGVVNANVSVTGNLTGCTLNGIVLPSGQLTGSGTASSTGGVGQCGLLLTAQFPTVLVTWSTGQTSNLTFTASTSPPNLSLSGTVTSGELNVDSVSAALVAVPNLLCVFTGLSSATITGAVSFN